MIDLDEWLNSLGLAEYIDLFAENKIDGDVLGALDEQDLKDLGIPLGHRKRLMRAIADIARNDEQAPNLTTAETVAEPNAGFVAQIGQPERRHLTVMFTDLAGSTALSVKFDPEDMREIIMRYQTCCETIVKRYNGYIANYLGDGILVYFGYPSADEHDPERAVRTALEIVDTIRTLVAHPDVVLHSRVGIATGDVVVGDLISSGTAQQHSVVGETPNLAARLQAIADLDAVVISNETRRLVGGLFELKDLGRHDLKGFEDHVQAWQVVSDQALDSRFAATRQGLELTPLTGRDEEIDILKRRWQEASSGAGQVVLLSGEAGIGKSRLLQELQDYASGGQARCMRSFCSPYHANSALFPVIIGLQRGAGIRRDMSAAEKLDRLNALVETAGLDTASVTPLYAKLLSVPTDKRFGALEISPQKIKDKTLEALVNQIKVQSSTEPLLLLMEDLHWIDPTTLEYLDLLIDEIKDHRILLLASYRPTFEPSCTHLPHVTTLPLSRLSRKTVEEAVINVAGKPLPAEIMHQIIDKSDGVPLFIEELTKTLLESGYLTDVGDHYEAAGPLPSFAIPTTLQDSLMARLDRLAPIKEVALIGAVIGRQFSYELLLAVSLMNEQDLEDALRLLIEAQLIYRRGTIPDAVFTFKHGLIQDAAYNSLVRTKRQRLHAGVAAAMETKYASQFVDQPEILARHYEAAGLTRKAIAYLRAAGERCIQRSENTEALNHLEHARELLGNLPKSAERDGEELPILLLLGAGYTMSKGWATVDAETVYRRAQLICDRAEETLEHFPVYLALHRFHALRGELREADRVGERLLAQAGMSDDKDYQLPANVAHGYNSLFLGELKRAEEYLTKGVSYYHPDQHQYWISRWGEDPGIVGLGFGALTQSILGHSEKAVELNAASLNAAQASSHQFSIGFSLWIATRVEHVLGNVERVREIAEDLLGLSREQGFPAWLGHALIMRGWALCMAGNGAEGLQSMHDGLAGELGAGALAHRTQYLALLGEALGVLGKPEEGLKEIAGAEEFMARTSEGYAESEIYRIKGELLAQSGGDPSTVRQCFADATAAAKRQKAKAWELRVQHSLKNHR
ncbi:MAG TPA: adenylate/guanylate cyclase domain-containing protein [Thermohalobaculum sp.]|nr:adenylate/guanylate cyclase domain-containing protein [Thermohalobaculum sp.]